MNDQDPTVVRVKTQAERDSDRRWGIATLGCLAVPVVLLVLGAIGAGCWYLSGSLAGPLTGWGALGILIAMWLLSRQRG